MTGDAGGIVTGQDLAEVGQNLVDREWSCRVWVDRVVAWCGCRGALATAPLVPATPGQPKTTNHINFLFFATTQWLLADSLLS